MRNAIRYSAGLLQNANRERCNSERIQIAGIIKNFYAARHADPMTATIKNSRLLGGEAQREFAFLA